jgi:hypothetical protein
MGLDDLTQRTGTTWVGKETAFNAGPATKLLLHGEEGCEVTVTTEQVPVLDERGNPYDFVTPTDGKTTGEAKLVSVFRAPLVKLIAAATPSIVNPQDHVFECLFGGKHVAAGFILAAGSTPTQLAVTPGDESRAPDGTILSVPIAGVYERARVSVAASGTLDVSHAISGTPATAAVVHNSYLYYPTRTNSKSLYVGHVQADESVTNWQWEAYGGTGTLTMTLEPGKPVKWTSDIKAARGQGPADYSLSQAFAALVETDGFFMSGALTCFRVVAATARVDNPIHKIEITFNLNNYLKTALSGRTSNGFTGVGRNPMRPAAVVKVTQEPDAAVFSAFTAKSAFELFIDLPLGSDTSASGHFMTLDFRRLVMMAAPDYKEAIEGARQGVYTFGAQLNVSAGTQTDLAIAPYVVATG